MTENSGRKSYFKKPFLYILLAQIAGVVLIGVYQVKGFQTALMAALLLVAGFVWWKIDVIFAAAYNLFAIIFKGKN